MKKTIKTIKTIALLILTLSSACQNKKQEKMQEIEKFDWVEAVNSPKGYPIEVYGGGFGLRNDDFVGMFSGPTTLEWGADYSGSNSGIKALPDKLDVSWVAFDERCLYTINCPIDYDKILALFKEGYQDSGYFFNRKMYKISTYNVIQAGFLPGGGVVVWVGGADKQVEIGRYQGHKTPMPKSVEGLDNHDKLYFSQDYYTSILQNPRIVPPDMQEYKKNNPIPFGLWDTYRTKYTWRPIMISNQSDWSLIYYRLEMFNGEFGRLFDQSLVKNEYTKRAIPKRINFAWKDKNKQVYSGTLWFNEQVIFEAFHEIYKDNPNGEAELELQVNIPNTFVAAFLKGNGKRVAINTNTKVEVFKSRKKY